MTIAPRALILALSLPLVVAACGPEAATDAHASTAQQAPTPTDLRTALVADTTLPGALVLHGSAAPLREATLSTKLMASVTEVLVHEGDVVRAGALLVRLDGRDLAAKAEQVAASTAGAQAMQAQAAAHAARMRALFAQDAAPKATLEAAEAALAQADAGLRTARAAAAELSSVASYAEVRAPFAGRVTARFVDPGAFAAPGAPLVSVQDATSLRITAHTTPEGARSLARGQVLEAMVEGTPVQATIEGVVPVAGGLYAVNALVANREARLLAGSAASLRIPTAPRRVTVIPRDALIREGDLVGVQVLTDAGVARRWIRIGGERGELVEVNAGLRAGERVVRASTPGAN
ncbi:MAG: efflux RND transporter periplasmic adaptor subunit [Gemmatimonadales bacterium]|nr:efflux RND transporter periplasmic adaptor subunit [Gemmatimonadales bacterium]